MLSRQRNIKQSCYAQTSRPLQHHKTLPTKVHKHVNSISKHNKRSFTSDNTLDNRKINSSVTEQIPSLLTEDQKSPRIAIIGSGPSAMYTAKYILQSHPEAHVHLIDHLLTPFGLVRNGIAPDHPEAKNVVLDFTTSVLNNPRSTFIGGIRVADIEDDNNNSIKQDNKHDLHKQSVTLDQIIKHYHGVVIATGASRGNLLHIPNEKVPGVYDSREFVSWYNGHPDYSQLNPPLSSSHHAIIIGNGNVALDISRLLLSPSHYLHHTDIPINIRQQLQSSHITDVYLCARRGIIDAAWTIPELREILTLMTATWNGKDPKTGESLVTTNNNDNNQHIEYGINFINAHVTPEELASISSNRAIKRKTDLFLEYMNKYSNNNNNNNHDASSSSSSSQETINDISNETDSKIKQRIKKTLHFVFNAKPLEINTIDNNNNNNNLDSHTSYVSGIKFIKTKYNHDTNKLIDTDEILSLPSSSSSSSTSSSSSSPSSVGDTIIIKSIGYRTIPLQGAPFDSKRHIYPSHNGRIIDVTATENQRKQHQPDNAIASSSSSSDIITPLEPVIVPSLYVSGWAKRGPKGILGTNIADARETAKAVVDDINMMSNTTDTSSSSNQKCQQPQPSYDLWSNIYTPVSSLSVIQSIDQYERDTAHSIDVKGFLFKDEVYAASPEGKKSIEAGHYDSIPRVKTNDWKQLSDIVSKTYQNKM